MSDEIKKLDVLNFFPNIQLVEEAKDLPPEQIAEIEEHNRLAREKFLKEERQKEIDRLKRIGIEERYLDASLESYECNTPERKIVLQKVKAFIANYKAQTLWMVGNSGTGKTMLAAIICKECYGSHYCKSYQIELALDDCKSFKATKSNSELIKDLSDYPLLVIDEVGKFESKEEVKYLFMIINERYEKNKSTVLITNKNKKELAEYLGKPIYDRFTENCMSIEFNFDSYRINKRQ